MGLGLDRMSHNYQNSVVVKLILRCEMLPLMHGILQAVREGKPFYWGVAGSLVLVGYGFLPTAQPTSNFGRIYAGAPAPP